MKSGMDLRWRTKYPIAEDEDGENGTDDEWFYVCSRKGRQVLRYRLTDGSAASAPFIRRRELGKGSQNAPEFMIRVTVPGN